MFFSVFVVVFFKYFFVSFSVTWQVTWTGWGMSLTLMQEPAWWSVSRRAWRRGTLPWWSSWGLHSRGTGFHVTATHWRPTRSPSAPRTRSTCRSEPAPSTMKQCLPERAGTTAHRPQWDTITKMTDRRQFKQSTLTTDSATLVATARPVDWCPV